jgi:hypothetical protein
MKSELGSTYDESISQIHWSTWRLLGRTGTGIGLGMLQCCQNATAAEPADVRLLGVLCSCSIDAREE